MTRTAVSASHQRAVFAVPAGNAYTSPVLALAMIVAPVIAQFHVAVLTGPAGIAGTSVTDAMAVGAAVQIAKFYNADDETLLSFGIRDAPGGF